MVGITSINSALLILRQNDAGHDVGDIIKTANADRTAEAVRTTAMNSMLVDLRPDPEALIPDEEVVHTFENGEYRTTTFTKDNNYMRSYDVLRRMVRDGGPGVQDIDLKSKIVQATTFPPASSPDWEKAVNDARYRVSVLVSEVSAANASYHQLKEIDPAGTSLDRDLVRFVNFQVHMGNMVASRYTAEYGEYKETAIQRAAAESGLDGTVTRLENGEYRIAAFKIANDDGKVVAELKDNGHFVIYNENGTMMRDMDREDVCAELTRGGSSHFARTAALLYTDDNDLELY